MENYGEIKAKYEAVATDIKDIKKRVDKLEEKNHQQDINNLKNTTELKELITSAVADGMKKPLTEIERLECRIKIIEDKEKETLEMKEEERKSSRKDLRKTIISCAITLVITFFGTILLNQIVDRALYNKDYSEEEQYYKQIEENYQKKITEMEQKYDILQKEYNKVK